MATYQHNFLTKNGKKGGRTMKTKRLFGVLLLGVTLLLTFLASSKAVEKSEFPQGTATPSEVCGECHKAIYREFAFGFGSDRQYNATTLGSPQDKRLTLPAVVSATATAHAFAGVDPFPIHGNRSRGQIIQCLPVPAGLRSRNGEPGKCQAKPRPKNQETDGRPCQLPLKPEEKFAGPKRRPTRR